MKTPETDGSSDILKLVNTVIGNDYCIGCGACAAVEESPIRIRLDKYGKFRATVEDDKIMKNVEVQSVCPFSAESLNEDELGQELFGANCSYDSKLGYHLATYAGYVKEGNYRANGSSGGIASWTLAELLNQGLVDKVIHVKPKAPDEKDSLLFRFAISSSVNEINEGAKSHYYPAEMSDILRIVRDNPARYAIVGIPCFIKSLRLLARRDPVFADRIRYCIGLICGYLPSTKFADLFAWQAGISPGGLIKINFRKKLPDKPASTFGVEVTGYRNEERKEPITEVVPFGYSWGSGFFKYNACDYCDDVVSETADLTVGDAWIDKYMADPKGTSLIIVRNPQLNDMIRNAALDNRIHCEEISPNTVAKSQSPAFRHRRDGLAYRLYLGSKSGQWHPRKRVKPMQYRFNFLFKKTHQYRIILARESHIAFQQAVEMDDLRVFNRKMIPLMRRYHFFIFLPFLIRRVRKRLRL